MRLLISIFAFCLGANAAVISYPWYDTIASDSLNLGLVAHWALEEASGTRADSEPTGTAQDLTDNNTVTQVAGKVGNAAFFTAANNEYLSHADSTDLSVGGGSFMITGWFKATSLTVNGVIASQWSVSPSAQRSWRYWFHSAVGKMEFEVSTDGTATVACPNVVFGLPPTNTWIFFAAWYDKPHSTINTSINNGTIVSTGPVSAVFDSTATFDLGARGASSDEWDGALDEISLWNRLLDGTELTRLYNAGVGKTCCPFVP